MVDVSRATVNRPSGVPSYLGANALSRDEVDPTFWRIASVREWNGGVPSYLALNQQGFEPFTQGLWSRKLVLNQNQTQDWSAGTGFQPATQGLWSTKLVLNQVVPVEHLPEPVYNNNNNNDAPCTRFASTYAYVPGLEHLVGRGGYRCPSMGAAPRARTHIYTA